MDFKKLWNSFAWKSEEEYLFTLPQTDEGENNNTIPEEMLNINESISSQLSSNLDYLKMKFNTMINSDIILREFKIFVCNRQYPAFLLFIDGMVDANLINDFVLKPLMLKNMANSSSCQTKKIAEEVNSNAIIRKVKKFDLAEYIASSLLPQNSIKKERTFEPIISGVNSGNCALFIDTLDSAFDIDVKGFKQRSVDKPANEIVVRGSQEAFTENIRTNTSLIRRLINNEKLIIENIEVGTLSKTKCAVCYMKNIANNELVSETKFRLNNVNIDYLISSRSIRTIN